MSFLRARLHLAIATPLQWRCDITPKSNVCVRSYTVTYSICDCDCNYDIAVGGHFVSDSWVAAIAVAVAVCKWALMASSFRVSLVIELGWQDLGNMPWHFFDN